MGAAALLLLCYYYLLFAVSLLTVIKTWFYTLVTYECRTELKQTKWCSPSDSHSCFPLQSVRITVASYCSSVLLLFAFRSLFGSTRISSPAIESINEDIDNLPSKRDYIHYAGPLQPLSVQYTHLKIVPEKNE